jgi:hypothetical protein
VHTAATVEIDAMPFLARGADEGGPFRSYFEAVQDLGADYVRFAEWGQYPKAVVAELRPPRPAAAGQACETSWNFTILDQITADFMEATRGHSVAPQVSAIPSWMYTWNGTTPIGVAPLAELPADPWRYTAWVGNRSRVDGDGAYAASPYFAGNMLRDQSCEEMAGYVGRLVGWSAARSASSITYPLYRSGASSCEHSAPLFLTRQRDRT